MTAEGVAAMTRFATSHIYTLARMWQKGNRENGLPCHKVGRSVRFLDYEVMDWLKRR
jgi:predicted DNA-binding transcriptional regulator AlpA